LPIRGRVIDAETRKPIEGAAVLIECTMTNRAADSYKVSEVVSDKEGNLDLPGCYIPYARPPIVTIYKKDYVAWNSREIFPHYDRRSDFEWVYGYEFKLQKFLSAYSYLKHREFIVSFYPPNNKDMLFMSYYANSENDMVIREQQTLGRSENWRRPLIINRP